MEDINDSKYRWLLDLCGFYKGEEKDPFEEELKRHEVDKSHLPPPECMKTEYRGLSVQRRKDLEDSSFYWGYESAWVGMMMHGGVAVRVLEEAIHYCPRSCEADDGVPLGIKAILMNRIEHWSGYWPRDESFMQNTMEPYYRLRHNPNKIRKGRRLLNQMRLEYITWHSYHDFLVENGWKGDWLKDRDHLDFYREAVGELRRRFDIVEAANGEACILKNGRETALPVHCAGGASRIERMLEHAESKGLTVVILGDYGLPPAGDAAYVHPEYKEIRELLMKKQGWHDGSSETLMTDYVGRYEGRYVYKLDTSPDGRYLIGCMTCIFDEDSMEFSHIDAFEIRRKAYKNP